MLNTALLVLLTAPASPPLPPPALAPLVVDDEKKKKDDEPDVWEELRKKNEGRKEGKNRKGWFVTSRYGFQLREPKKWNQIAVQTEEEWLACKYQSEKEYFWTDPELGWTMTHRPEMLVIAFPREVMKKRGKVVDEDETEEGTKIVTVTFKNPYKDYDDFLERTYSGSGFFKAEEEKEEIDGIPVTKRIYRAEKLAQTGPKYIAVWLYDDGDVEYALQTEVLQDEWKKLKRTVENTYKSFELIKRDAPISHDGSTSSDRIFTFRDLNDSDPKERRSKRMQSERAMQEKAIAKLPEHWEHDKGKRALVLSNCDDRWAKRVMSHTENMLEWLDDNFGFIGPGEYVRTPIVRICKDSEEEFSFRRGVDTGGWSWFSSDTELVTSFDDTGWIGSEIDYLNRDIFNFWLNEKNVELGYSMPDWLRTGLYEALEGARMDGRKPEFRRDEWDAEMFREAMRNDTLTETKKLFLMTSSEYMSSGFWNRTMECQVLVSFLISDEARRCRQAKGLIEEYTKNLMDVIKEAEEEYASDLKAKLEVAEDEEEEKELVGKLRSAMSKREKTILERTFERTFGDWDDKDWERFTKAYHESV